MINFKSPIVIPLNESSIAQEVIRNVSIIITTLENTVPYDREFGLTPDFIDAPLNISKELYTVNVLMKIKKYEARANVEKVRFEADDINGKLIPKVVISIEPI